MYSLELVFEQVAELNGVQASHSQGTMQLNTAVNRDGSPLRSLPLTMRKTAHYCQRYPAQEPMGITCKSFCSLSALLY